MKRLATLMALVLTLALAGTALAARVDAVYTANLTQLNGSGATGHATLLLRGDQLTVKVNVHGVEAGFPHLQHIHGFADGSQSTCPPPSADTDGDGLVSVTEGSVFYGGVFVTTLSTDGSQNPLGLAAAPVANTGGSYSYSYTFTVDPATVDLTDEAIVVHGSDLNGDGAYSDFMEASLPVLCGQIVQRH